MLVLYGMGTTIGAGIYALVGVVAGRAGAHTPVAFALAGVLAGLMALTLAELSRRFPKAAGEAVYVEEGFRAPRLAMWVGLSVATAGIISAATVTRGFAAYLAVQIAWPDWVFCAVLVAVSAGVAARGIDETAWLAAILTLLEIGGLVVVIYVCGDALAELPDRVGELWPPLERSAWQAVIGASVVCFYAFLGFEDMINVAEEVKDVTRTLPLAIVLTLIGTLGLYLVLTMTAVLAVPPAELAGSEAPLAMLYQRATGHSPWLLSGIGAIAMSNGALIQIVKSSRILYGLAVRGTLPPALAAVDPQTRTPLLATLVVSAAVLLLSLGLSLETLAEATALITLAVFAMVCLALLRIRARAGGDDEGFTVPLWVPVLGGLVSLALLVLEAVRLLWHG